MAQQFSVQLEIEELLVQASLVALCSVLEQGTYLCSASIQETFPNDMTEKLIPGA